jgi:hypothetical protein
MSYFSFVLDRDVQDPERVAAELTRVALEHVEAGASKHCMRFSREVEGRWTHLRCDHLRLRCTVEVAIESAD